MNLTKVRLDENLTDTERLYLHSMAQHEGFPVLKKLFDEACKEVTADVVKLDPSDDKYASKLQFFQQRAYIINEFCEGIRKSFSVNFMIAEKANSGEKKNAGPNSSTGN